MVLRFECVCESTFCFCKDYRYFQIVVVSYHSRYNRAPHNQIHSRHQHPPLLGLQSRHPMLPTTSFSLQPPTHASRLIVIDNLPIEWPAEKHHDPVPVHGVPQSRRGVAATDRYQVLRPLQMQGGSARSCTQTLPHYVRHIFITVISLSACSIARAITSATK